MRVMLSLTVALNMRASSQMGSCTSNKTPEVIMAHLHAQGLVDAKAGELAESAHRNVQLGARVRFAALHRHNNPSAELLL